MSKLAEWVLNLIGFICCLPLLLAMVMADRFGKKTEDGSGKALPDASRPGEAHGCYVEDDRTRELREAYVGRRDGERNKRAIRTLIESVGRN